MTVVRLPRPLFQFTFGKEDIYELLRNPHYIMAGLITTIGVNGGNSDMIEGDITQKARYLRDKFLSCNTLVIRHLETYNEEFINYCRLMGKGTTINCKVNPIGGRSFNRHFDYENVILILQSGEKLLKFWTRDQENELLLKQGDAAYIPAGVEHEVYNILPSIALSLSAGANTSVKLDETLLVQRDEFDRMML